MRPNYYKAEVQVSRIDGDERDVAILECFDLIDALAPSDFYVGNAIKYVFRAGRKEGQSKAKDLAKAITYLEIAKRRLSPGPSE